MAHNLETRNGQTSFVAVGQTAWHGLGTYVNEAMTAEQCIKLARLDYTVEKREIFTSAPDQSPIIIPDMFATVRTDTNQPLGVVSDMYHVVQNIEAFNFFDSIIDKGEAIYQTAGVLGVGEKIFITAKLPSDIVVNGEQVENYLLITSGHDGKSSIQVGFTSIRVVCNNTLQAALKGLQNKVSILHFKNANQKLNHAAKIMGMSSKYTLSLQTEFEKMAKVKITDTKLREYIETVMSPATIKNRETLTKEQLDAMYSTRFIKTVDGIMDFAHTHPTQTTKAAKGTVWGAYNAISGYFGYLKSYGTQEEKFKDQLFNGGANKIESAFALASSMI